MKKNEVKIGQCYMAKVTNSVVPVRIESVKGTGWSATNLATGKTVYIKTAQRLRHECTQADLAGFDRPTSKRKKKSATKANTSPTTDAGAKSVKKATKKATGAKGRNTAQTDAKSDKSAKPKRISGLTAAFMVLVDADAELGAKAIVEIAAQKDWWKSDAVTPAATIYAAMIREIATKDDRSRFERGAKRGTFRARYTPTQKRELFGKMK